MLALDRQSSSPCAPSSTYLKTYLLLLLGRYLPTLFSVDRFSCCTMKLLILFVVAMCSAAWALTETEIAEKWTNFKTQYGKNYADEKEEAMRKQLFLATLQKVEEHNKKYERGEVTYTQGINKFADLTEEEKRPYSHGVLRPADRP